MTTVTRFKIAKSFAAIGVAVSAMLASSPAQAQAVNGSVPAEIQVFRSLTIQVDRPLIFGAILSGATDGVVTISANNANNTGTRTVPSAVDVPGVPFHSAQITIIGEANANVQINNLPQALDLACSCGDVMDLDPTDNLPPGRILTLSNPGGGLPGQATFYIGADATYAAGMRSGRYTGTVPISANYP